MVAETLNAPIASPRFNPTPVISLLLFIALFTGFQGGRYYAGNIAQELGILCAIILFGVSGFFSAFHIPRDEWNRWILVPTSLVVLIPCVWGTLFALKFGGNPLHNVLASREFFFVLVSPAIYLCVRAGYPLKNFERVFWAVLVASMLNYLFNYFRMDLREAFFSPDYRISSLITYDEWRGFRLKPPLFAIMIGLLASLTVVVSARNLLLRIFAILVASVALYIWSIVMFRSTLATMVLSLLMYPIFIVRPNRLALALIVLPLAILATPAAVSFLFEGFTGAEGGNVRMGSYQLALNEIPKNWLLGIGEDSAFGQTYGTLYGAKFFPSDLGLIGVTFKYGFVGLFMYLFAHFGILTRLWRTNWFHCAATGRTNPLIFALLIFFCAQTFNLILNPGLAYAQGITVGSTAVAYACLIRRYVGASGN